MTRRRRLACLSFVLAALVFHSEAAAQSAKVAGRAARKVLSIIEKWGSKVEGEAAKLTAKDVEKYKGNLKSWKLPRDEPSSGRVPKLWRPSGSTPDSTELTAPTQVAEMSWWQGGLYAGRVFKYGDRLFLRVSYTDPFIGLRVVDQELFVGYHENCDALLVGANPVFANTNQPVLDYLPDSFCFGKTALGEVEVVTCQSGGCAKVNVQ